MTHYGKIKSYDGAKGAGMIVPDKGGRPLAFVKADLQQEAQEPQVDQRYGYETRQVGDSQPEAINLQLQQGETDRNEKQSS